MKKKASVWPKTLALAALAVELVFVNLLPSAEETHQAASGNQPEETRQAASGNQPEETHQAAGGNQPEETRQAASGNQPGEALPDFTITLTDGTEFRLSDMKGRIVLINLWATWCAPCVNELPFFDALQAERPEDVFVLAVHSDLVTDDVNAYLERFDYKMAFAVDASGDVYSLVGGSSMLPQTIVLDRDGTVTYNQVGSVTHELLEELVDSAEATQKPSPF